MGSYPETPLTETQTPKTKARVEGLGSFKDPQSRCVVVEARVACQASQSNCSKGTG